MLALAAAHSHAQTIRGLDDDRFVQGLIDRGMDNLAAKFLEGYKSDDPIVRLEMLTRAAKLRARNAKLPLAQRKKALLDGIDAYRQLFKAAPPQHWKSPVWKTDFAQYALTTVLNGELYLSAADFVEFGKPMLEQEKLFAELVPEIATVMDEAYNEMFFLIGELPRRDNFTAEFENTGRWEMLKKEYFEAKLPFFQALSWHYASLLPKPPAVARPADAEAALSGMVERGGLNPIILARVHTLIGRIRVKLGKPQEALKALDAAAAVSGADPGDLFIAQLTRAQALAAQKKNEEALKLLDAAAGGPVAAKSPVSLILVFDSRFRITHDTGEYNKLLAHPAAASSVANIKQFVNRRIIERNPIAANSADITLEGKTALEVLAQVDAVMEGSGKPGADKGKMLESAQKALEALLQRGGLSPADEGATRFKLGWARRSREDNLGAIQAWVELASKLPERPESENAAKNAYIIAEALRKKLPENKQVGDLYESALTTLLTRYPLAKLGPDKPVSLLWYTLGGYYRQRETYEKAVEAYGKVASDHPFYPDAVFENLACRFAIWLAADGEGKKKLAELFVAAADRTLATLTGAPAADDARKEKLTRMEGQTILFKSQVGAESLGQGGAVRVALKDYESKYDKFPDLVNAKRQLMVNVLLQLGQVSDAKSEVEKFVQANPGHGGPLIKGVLDTLHRQIDDARRVNRNDPRLVQLRQAGLDMARDLLGWAKLQKDIAGDPAKLLAFENIYGLELIDAGQCAEAVKLYEDLLTRDFGNGKSGADQLDVLLGLGKSCYCAARAAADPAAANVLYEKAQPPLNKIINKASQFSEPWWEAWLTRIKCLDAQYDELARTDQATAKARRDRDIYLAIQKLEKLNEAMGGAAFKSEFLRLRNKNASN